MGGIRGQLKKTRTLFLTGQGQTRIHLDQIENLSSNLFIELEVILNENQTIEQGQIIADQLCQKIGIQKENYIHSAYIDLILFN